MCIFRIPQHPWCLCTNPSTVDANGKLICPHHISVQFDGPAVTGPAVRAYLTRNLAGIYRPAPKWEHCATYIANHTTSYGYLDSGHELSCPRTLTRQALYQKKVSGSSRLGHEEVYQSDGLCSLCNVVSSSSLPSSKIGNTIPLRLVPLTEQFEADPDSVHYNRRRLGQFDGSDIDQWEELMPCGFTLPEGDVVDDLLEDKIRKNRSACDGGEGVYVDVVDGPYKGQWGVDLDRSAVYLLPESGYDPAAMATALAQDGKKETAGRFSVKAISGAIKNMKKLL